MPLRKRKTKTSPVARSARRPGTTRPGTKSPANQAGTDITIDLRREQDLQWAIEQTKREFQHKKRTPMPQDLRPTLATITSEAFNDEDWQFEIKWDGYRALAYVAGKETELRSRNNLSFNRKFKAVADSLQQWPVNAVVDGEIVVLGEDGRADFGALQAWDKKPRGQIFFYVFDILWVEGIDLRKEPLTVRREVLKRFIPENSLVRFSESIDEYGVDFFEAAKENRLEGIIAKRKQSTYQTGTRTRDWLKIKAEQRHEAIICGYTKKADTDRLFSSLVLGIPKGKGIEYIGQAGTGFSGALQEQLMKKMKALTTDACPFPEEPALSDFVQWTRPFLVCEVKYTELTSAGIMRHAAFLGLREDKTLADINLEESSGTKQNKKATKAIKNGLFTAAGKREDAAIVPLDGQELQLSNLGKVYWPKEKITKGDLLNYYYEMAPYILPYMQGRPQSLNRFPNGINGESFYQKNMKGKVNEWLTTFERFSESDGDAKDFLVCTHTASLLYMANLGCIEMNPWHSRISSPHYPDWCVIDLDPGQISFEKVIETARVVLDILTALGVPSYPKTSGSTGIHIYVPLGAKYNYEQSKQFAELIANLAHQELPATTSLVRSPQKRKDKIYIDYLQNRPIQTICAPYSVRPKPGATVSAPLHWEEVKKGLKMSHFTMKNILQRVKAEGDLFQGVLGKGIDLNDVMKTMAAML